MVTVQHKFESGQEKGGTFYCSGCSARADRVNELDYCFHSMSMSPADRQTLMLKVPVGRRNSIMKKAKPLARLTKDELAAELNARQIFEGEKKKDLERELREEMHGVQRVPALLYLNPTANLQDLGLQHYEILVCEPLHDIAHHIENILDELPSHLPKDECAVVQEVVEVTLGGKEAKRGVDYRCALIVVANCARGKVSEDAQRLLDTLVEIQEILYSGEEERCPRMILRYHNLTWLHAVLCFKVIGNNIKTMTPRKFYGTYFHDLSSHAPMQLRIVSGRSANTKEVERMFNTIKGITKRTSSGRTQHIVGNLVIRLQAEEELGNKKDHVKQQQSQVSKLAKSSPKLPNTIIPRNLINSYSRSWQCHLEQISDFLLPGGVW